MRTNIDIDDELMAKAMAATNAATKKATVEQALQLLIRLKAQEGVKKWFGKVQWEGDLAAMREGRYRDWDNRREGDLTDVNPILAKVRK
jgi:Arc/MetJ family transcription regulator